MAKQGAALASEPRYRLDRDLYGQGQLGGACHGGGGPRHERGRREDGEGLGNWEGEKSDDRMHGVATFKMKTNRRLNKCQNNFAKKGCGYYETHYLTRLVFFPIFQLVFSYFNQSPQSVFK